MQFEVLGSVQVGDSEGLSSFSPPTGHAVMAEFSIWRREIFGSAPPALRLTISGDENHLLWGREKAQVENLSLNRTLGQERKAVASGK
jgi:hypothetical protein